MNVNKKELNVVNELQNHHQPYQQRFQQQQCRQQNIQNRHRQQHYRQQPYRPQHYRFKVDSRNLRRHDVHGDDDGDGSDGKREVEQQQFEPDSYYNNNKTYPRNGDRMRYDEHNRHYNNSNNNEKEPHFATIDYYENNGNNNMYYYNNYYEDCNPYNEKLYYNKNIRRHDDGLQQSYKRPPLHLRFKDDNKYPTYYYPRSRSPSYQRSIDYIKRQSLPPSSPSSILKQHEFDDYLKNRGSLTTTPLTKTSTTPIEKPPLMLIVLDLNGTLVYRDGVHRLIHPRPYISIFKNYLFRNKNFNIMIWSSAQRINVNKMVKEIFGNDDSNKLLEIWSRDKFPLTNKEYHSKCLTIKDLEMVWDELNKSLKNKNIQPSSSSPPSQSSTILWDQTNTILIDDSPLKAQLQPYNAIHLKEFNRELFHNGNDSELLNVIEYLELLKCQSNISHFIKNRPYDSNRNYANHQNEINIESVSDDTRAMADNYDEEDNEEIIELDLDEEDL
nr:7467_t:CDS:2 [Entrophospora candida]